MKQSFVCRSLKRVSFALLLLPLTHNAASAQSKEDYFKQRDQIYENLVQKTKEHELNKWTSSESLTFYANSAKDSAVYPKLSELRGTVIDCDKAEYASVCQGLSGKKLVHCYWRAVGGAYFVQVNACALIDENFRLPGANPLDFYLSDLSKDRKSHRLNDFFHLPEPSFDDVAAGKLGGFKTFVHCTKAAGTKDCYVNTAKDWLTVVPAGFSKPVALFDYLTSGVPAGEIKDEFTVYISCHQLVSKSGGNGGFLCLFEEMSEEYEGVRNMHVLDAKALAL